MKKIISTILAVIIAISCVCAISACAESEELLTNGDFETGDSTGFNLYGPQNTMTVDGAYAHGGSYGAAVSERGGIYATRNQDITDIITEWGAGEYKASGWARLSDEGGDCTCLLVINYRITGESKDKYITSDKVQLTASWKKFSISSELSYNEETGLDHVYIYFQVVGSDNTSAPTFYMDDLSLKKVSEKSAMKATETSTTLTHIDYSGVARSEQTTVGAIRWDAWYGHDGVEQSVISQVERSLSPAEFHYRAPFFATVTAEGKIEIPEYTQEIFDKEMEYAIDAGLDYFAFLMYSTDMQKARNFYKKSSLNNKIKMCCIMSPGQSEFHSEIIKLFQEDYYMTVLDGHPLLYFYIGNTNQIDKISEEVEWFRTACAKKNIKEPYVAVMTGSTDKVTVNYADAAARYAISGSNGEAFSSLMAKAKTIWYDGKFKAGQVIPNVTFGWQNLPRYKNPVSWTKSSAESYAQDATEDELYQAVKDAIEFCNTEDNISCTPANTISIYAWNEHDEGGWICPTIAVDENGNQLFNDDGTPQINTSHLNALKRAIGEYKGGSATPGAGDSSADGATASPVDTSAASAQNITSKAIIPAVCVALLAIAAVTVTIIIKKKQKNI